MDPTVVQTYVPQRFFVAEYWRHAVPLWNSLSGFGMPLLADPQTFVLSPLFALCHVFPSMYVWNLVLVFELVIGAVSIFYLSKELELSPPAAACAALLFVFSPWAQWLLELLGNGICLTPFVVLFFVRAGKKMTLVRSAIAGFAASIMVLSAHPENSFVAIAFAVLLMFLISHRELGNEFRLAYFSGHVFAAGLIAFGLSAPLLVPFGELILNGDTYKLAGQTAYALPLEALVAHFCYPFYSHGSLYWGPLAWLGLPISCAYAWRVNRLIKPLLWCLFLNVLMITHIFPFSMLEKIPPFSMLMSTYLLAGYDLLIVLLSAAGIDYILQTMLRSNFRMSKNALFLTALPVVLTVIMLPWHQFNPTLHIDKMLDPPHFKWKIWLFNALCASPILLTALVGPKRLGRMALITFLFSGIADLIIVSYDSLPLRPQFSYPAQLPIDLKLSEQARLLSTGDHLYRPYTNLVYKQAMVKFMNPLFPKGYAKFMEAAGAKVDGWNQTFSVAISRLIDLTGAGVVLSEQPIFDSSQSICTAMSANAQTITFGKELKLSAGRLAWDAQANAVYWRLSVRPIIASSNVYSLCVAARDPGGRPVSYIEPYPISGSDGAVVSGSSLIPSAVKHWRLEISICDSTGQLLPINSSVPTGRYNGQGWFELGDSGGLKNFVRLNNSRFRLINRQGGFLVYENRTALKRYSWMKDVVWSKDRQAALNWLQENADKLGDLAVLEDSDKGSFSALSKVLAVDTASSFDQSGSVQEVDSAHAGSYIGAASAPNLMVEVKKPGLMLVSDLYYPGWKAYLDGDECRMFRADYLVRALLIPAGKHNLRFEYDPASFQIGLCLFILTLATLLWFIFRGVFRSTCAVKPGSIMQ